MAKFAFLVPTIEVLNCVRNVVHEIDIHDIHMEVITTDQVVESVQRVTDLGADIIIARGYQASKIRKYTNIPVVDIIMTGQNMGLLITRGKAMLDIENPTIGVIGYKNMFCDMQHFGEIFGVTIKTYYANETKMLAETSESAIQDKLDLIIGGEIALTYAQKANIPALPLDTTEDTIQECIDVATGVSRAVNLEREHSAHLKALLDYSFSAMVELDENGIIVILNFVAETLLGWKITNVIGKRFVDITNAIDETQLSKVLKEGEEIYSTLLKINDTTFVANLAPIKADGKITGAIFSCQELKRIEAIGSEIWRNSLRNGFIAHYKFQMMQEPSQRILQTIGQAKLYAQSVSPVLLCNEVGAEHDLFAQSIHNESPRKNAPYVSTECSQMEPAKQLALLFGNSDSKSSDINQKGLIANAHEGTIFLKSIENLCMEGQYRLKVLLKEHLIISEGDVGPLRLDVRVIAETSADLPALVSAGSFDKELYYALNVLYLRIPPLREREEDILYWVDKYVIKYREQYGRYIVLTSGAKNFLMKYKWPGNLLQLKQFCDRMVLCASRRSVDEIYLESLLAQMYPSLRHPGSSESVIVYKAPEAARISEVLDKNGGNRTVAAKELGMSKTTLWRKIKKFNISDKI